FGGLNHQFYEKVFELLLRMKGNFLWPAMWGNAFNDDDTLNARLADEYGVVMGTSHHEPMLRAQQEWKRYGSGAWNYETNATVLQSFWRQGIRNMGAHESIVTVGMRGDGDMPMSEQSNSALLERIVADQRRIISEVTGRDASATPQVWALYKEVQDYYDRGMRVPDDVTLLFADDNWGNIRRLPRPGAAARAGGYGVYYHFDYVGGPRNYKWINTNQIERVWEQMHLAYAHGVDRIWIVNVGDIKPMELPLQFFLDYAWRANDFPVERMAGYTRRWAGQQFGAVHADSIADILALYTKYNARRKPELLSPETYSLVNYHEADRVVNEYNALAARAASMNERLAPQYRDAFYQLVLYPVEASANINELYVTVARNRRYAAQRDPLTNQLADRAADLFARDARLAAYYNDTLAGGKWRHMMDQTRIGYTYWQQPPTNVMPTVQRIDASAAAVAAEPAGTAEKARPTPASRDRLPAGFVESDGYVSMEAEHFSRAVASRPVQWVRIPNLGRTASSMTAFPVTMNPLQPGGDGAHLEYAFHFQKAGPARVQAYLSPTLDFADRKGLRYGISIDDEPVQVVNVLADTSLKAWERAVADNVRIGVSQHIVDGRAGHILKFWLVDPGVVLQKLVVDAGGLKPSYLGPPESYYNATRGALKARRPTSRRSGTGAQAGRPD
ncbi:MAG TPA: glycosyl hydrolase 115 family protein, partial [Longimicrobiales bacterium]